MELALYHPECGYYARAAQRSGRDGDFFTSVDVGPLFGGAIAAQLAEMWERLRAGGDISAFAFNEPRLWLRVERIEPGTAFSARLHASARFALSARAATSFAWEQANPEDRAESQPPAVRVKADRKPR